MRSKFMQSLHVKGPLVCIPLIYLKKIWSLGTKDSCHSLSANRFEPEEVGLNQSDLKEEKMDEQLEEDQNATTVSR